MLLFIKINFLFLYLTIFFFLLKSAKLPWKSRKSDEKLQKFNFIDNHFTSEMYYFLYLIKLIFEVALFDTILQISTEIKEQQQKNKCHKCCIYRLATLVKYCQIVWNLGQRPKGLLKLKMCLTSSMISSSNPQVKTSDPRFTSLVQRVMRSTAF